MSSMLSLGLQVLSARQAIWATTLLVLAVLVAALLTALVVDPHLFATAQSFVHSLLAAPNSDHMVCNNVSGPCN